MKVRAVILPLLLFFFASSCKKDKTGAQPGPIKPNKVCLLLVNRNTGAFEGGKEFICKSAESFTISTDYQSASDFGYIKLYYKELDKLLFNGTTVWLSTGDIVYPKQITPAADFQTITNAVSQPTDTLFRKIKYNWNAWFPQVIPYDLIWSGVENLEVVAEYRKSNPGSHIDFMVYNDKWVLVLKN